MQADLGAPSIQPGRLSPPRPPPLAYVTTGYPHLSHTFIQREVHGLRAQGATVHTFSVERSLPEHVLSARDREDLAATYAIRPVHLLHVVAAHLRALATRPGRWSSTLRAALSSAGPDPRAALWQVFYFAQAVVLWDRVRRTDARHIHAHFANVSSDLAMLASRVGGPGWTWSFTMHGPREFSDLHAFGVARKAAAADFVVCISDYCRSQVMSLLDEDEWDKLEIVHCAVEADQFVPPIREEHEGAMHVLFVGRLVPVKGVAVLLDALAVLRAEGLSVELKVVGAGPGREHLERRSEALGLGDDVSFAGAVGQDDIAAHYAEADVFALTSFAEGVPVVLMEAMAMGLPVIASTITGVPELVVDGTSGLLVGPGDAAGVAAALRTLSAAGAAGRTAMGVQGRARVLEEFETTSTSRHLADVFGRRIGTGARIRPD